MQGIFTVVVTKEGKIGSFFAFIFHCACLVIFWNFLSLYIYIYIYIFVYYIYYIYTYIHMYKTYSLVLFLLIRECSVFFVNREGERDFSLSLPLSQLTKNTEQRMLKREQHILKVKWNTKVLTLIISNFTASVSEMIPKNTVKEFEDPFPDLSQFLNLRQLKAL